MSNAAAVRRYAAKYPEKIRVKNAKNRSKPGYPEAQANSHLLRTYGITLLDKARMLHMQGGKCAICPDGIDKLSDAFVDHNHATEKIRGILCSGCNTLLGSAKEQISILHSAVDYLERYNGV